MKLLSPHQLVRLEQLFNQARQYHQASNFPQAEKMYREILAQIPLQADTLNALGMLLQQQGKMDEAIEIFIKATRANKSAAHIQLNLGEALRAAKRFKEASAAIKRALQIRPQYPEAQFCLGSLLHDQKEQIKAIEHYRKAIKLMPTLALAHNALGAALQEIGDYKGAQDAQLAALRLQPDNAEFYLNLANTYFKMEDFAQAEKTYRTCLRIDPTIAQAHLGLAWLLTSGLSFDDTGAEGHVNYAQEHLPTSAESLYVQGKLRIQQGRHDEARALFRQSIEMSPIAPAIFEYSHAGKFEHADSFVINAANKLTGEKGVLNAEGHGLIHFSLGKMHDDLRQYADAFEHYAKGNEYIHQALHYDQVAEESQIERLIALFTTELFAKHAEDGNPSSQPTFIVGMPRSGTTLIEQVISAHPDTFAAGELSSMKSVEDALTALPGDNPPYPELLKEIDSSKLRIISEGYIDQLNQRFPGSYGRIIDKMPHNFLRVGLVALLFPNAKIINTVRNPMDNCLSLFFQKFVGDYHAYSYDIANLGHQYLLYKKLMKHWHEVLPGRIFDINYEDMIADSESWSRKLIDFVGLEWDDACLAPHKLERTVKTASHWQVRQPIYKSSVARWKHYEKHLDPLKAALGYKD